MRSGTGLRSRRSADLGPAFRQIVWARSLIWIAGAVTAVALPLAMYHRTGSAGLTAVLAAFEATPYLLVGLPAGALADRRSARTVSLICCVLCTCASGSIPIVAAFDLLTTVHLFVSAFVANTALVFFDASMFAVLPAAVPRDQLVRAFSTTIAVSTIIRLAGPAGGGLIAAAITPVYTLAVDAAMFLCAAVVFLFFAEPARSYTAPGTSVVATIVEGISFIRRTAVVRTLTLLGTGNAVAEGVVTGMLIPTVIGLYGRSQSGGSVGLTYSTIAAGALLGTLVSPHLGRRARVGDITVVGLITAAAGLTGWAWSPGFGTGLAALVLYQFGATVVILNGMTVRALLTPDELQGRVNTTARMIAWGGQPVGAYLAGGIVGFIGVATTLTVGAAVLVVTALAAVATRNLLSVDTDTDLDPGPTRRPPRPRGAGSPPHRCRRP